MYMPPEGATEAEVKAVERIRSRVADILHPRYDTYFNILRWLQSYDFNEQKTLRNLRRHLKFRKERHMDEDARDLQSCAMSAEYAPISIIGLNRQNGDRVIVIDQGGKIDIDGIMKSVQPTEYVHQFFRYFEKMLTMLNEMEAKLGVQCYVYYIIDLHGLSFDPTLVGTLTGPYRVSWQLVNQHYREFVERYIFIHTPSYLSVIGKAIARLVPEKVRRRIMVIGKEWPEKMLEIGDRDYFPKRYGGEIPDEKVLRDPKPVPKNLYWRPRPDYPSVSTMYHFSIPAGKSRTLSYYAMAGSYLFFYSQNDENVTMSIFYTEKEGQPEKDDDFILVPTQKCGLEAVDLYMQPATYTGYYHYRVASDSLRLFPVTYKMITLDENGMEVQAINQKEKWIKPSTKALEETS